MLPQEVSRVGLKPEESMQLAFKQFAEGVDLLKTEPSPREWKMDWRYRTSLQAQVAFNNARRIGEALQQIDSNIL